MNSINDNILIDHAVRHVWCSPYQDNQYIVDLEKITDNDGALNEMMLFHRLITLPMKQVFFQGYMLGFNVPEKFLFPTVTDQWIKMIDWCNEKDICFRLYNQHGAIIPLDHIYYLREKDGNILFFIKDIKNNPWIDLARDKLSVFVRSGEYWRGDHTTSVENRTFYRSLLVDQHGVDINFYNDYLRRRGEDHRHPISFINGVVNTRLNRTNFRDIIDMIDDGSIQRVEHQSLISLSSFYSDLDKKDKYLYYLRDSQDMDKVHYRDDIDIYLVKYQRESIQRIRLNNPDIDDESLYRQAVIEIGCYYPRNKEDSVRMITHQAYALPCEYIQTLIRHYDPNYQLDQWVVKFVIKEDGLNRRIIDEVNYMKHLSVLPHELRVKVLTDTTSTVKCWKAEELEKAPYNYLMRCLHRELTPTRGGR